MAVRHVKRPDIPRVLITGATGFAGGFLVEQYLGSGWDVWGTTRSEPGEDRAWVPPALHLDHVDLQRAEDVQALLARVRPDVVHHLAAQSSVSMSWQNPLATLQGNAAMQFHLLEAVKHHVPRARVVVIGSSDEYGNVTPGENPLTEMAPLRPVNPYALSKVVQDLMGLQYAEQGLQVVRVRPFLQLGPRRSDRFVAGSFARQVAEIELGLRSAVIEVGNVDLQRDFIDVRDAARALFLAAERGHSGAVYNIASGEAHSLRDLLRGMLCAAGVQAEIRQDPDRLRQAEPPLLVGDASLLRLDTGWMPRYSFQDAVAETLDYWRQRVREEMRMERIQT